MVKEESETMEIPDWIVSGAIGFFAGALLLGSGRRDGRRRLWRTRRRRMLPTLGEAQAKLERLMARGGPSWAIRLARMDLARAEEKNEGEGCKHHLI